MNSSTQISNCAEKFIFPSLNCRLSLLFSDEDSGSTGNDKPLINDNDAPDDISLQYEARQNERYRIDFRMGLRSSLHPRASVRYKYEHPVSDMVITIYSKEEMSGLQWNKPESYLSWEYAAVILLRLEAVFHKDFSRHKK